MTEPKATYTKCKLMAKKRVSTFPLGEETQTKLQRANLKTVEDVLSLSFLQLMTVLRFSADEVRNLICILSSACLPRCYTGYDLLTTEARNIIQFGDAALDHLLHGGLKPGTFLEITGPPGVGKTQLCFHFLVKSLVRCSKGSICCIDTEGAFKSERLLEMLRECDGIAGREEELLSRFHIFQPKTVESLTEILKSLELFCIEKEIVLVVVDSIASLARKEFSVESGFRRAETLSSWAAQFKALAHQLNMVVIVTNQVTSRFSQDEPELREEDDNGSGGIPKESFVISPALGGSWTHFVNTRLILQFQDSDVRQLIIAKSPTAPITVKNFRIVPSGVEFFGELSYTYTGMNPDKHRIKVQPSMLN